MRTFQIEILPQLSEEMIEYIFDCWVEFITQDLGLKVNDAILYETTNEKKSA